MARAQTTRQAATSNGVKLVADLTKFRLEKGLTYQQLAASIGGIHYSTLARAILSGRPFSARIAHKVERFLEAIRA